MQDRKKDTDVYNGILDSEGEGEGGMIWENGILTSSLCPISNADPQLSLVTHICAFLSCPLAPIPTAVVQAGLIMCITMAF